MKCFYHNDADGKCAGFYIHLFLDKDIYTPIEFIEINYGTLFPMDSIMEDEPIYIVDYSISPDEMRELLKITKDVTWIDHHRTSIEKYEDFEHDIRGIRYDGVAACMLTYCYFRHMTDNGIGSIKPFDISMTYNAPKFTKLIADWDVWKFEYGDDSRFFITAFNSCDYKPSSSIWNKYRYNDEEACDYSIERGKIMTNFRDGWAKDYMKLGFETEFNGLKCFAVNLGHCNSDYFKSIPINKYDAFIPFVFDGTQYIVSLYSTDADVSEIAKIYGGGGHKNAAGFQCKELPFSK